MTSIESALSGENSSDAPPLQVGIPPGYSSIPLDNVSSTLQESESVLLDIAGAESEHQINAMLRTLHAFLSELVSNGALYCGIGRHAPNADGTAVTSTLVISYQEYQGTRNPRILLNDLLQAKTNAGEQGQADLVDVLEHPTLFFERTQTLPTPQLPGQAEVPDDQTTSIYQLEASVPSEDGSKIAIIEFSTPFRDYGPEFRTMVVQLASSVSFDPPAQPPESTNKIQQLLG